MSRQLPESRRDSRDGHGGPELSGLTKPVPAAAVDFDRIVRDVRSVLEPAAIVLFGSYARGDFGPFSDIDLLVVRAEPFARGESRRRELGSLYRALAPACELPKDILLFTRDEVAAWKETTNHMVAMAAKEGRVLYGQL
jgi:predicted nucleotidyltransferase